MCWSVAFHKILELMLTQNCCAEQSAVQIAVSVTVHLDEWCSETPSDCQSSYAWTSMQSHMYMVTVEPCLYLSPSAVTLVNFFCSFWQEASVLFNFRSSLVQQCTWSSMNYQAVCELWSHHHCLWCHYFLPLWVPISWFSLQFKLFK